MNRTVGSPNPLSAASSVRTPVAHSASATPIATMPDRHPARDEQDDGGRQDREDDRDVAHRARRARGGRRQSWTGYPGPSGMPSTNHSTNSRIQTTATMTAYGSIRAMIVPMPASFW